MQSKAVDRKQNDQGKAQVERRKQQVVEIKNEIDKILDDIPSVVAKSLDDHKYILDCQFMPKLHNAQDKVRHLDQQL